MIQPNFYMAQASSIKKAMKKRERSFSTFRKFFDSCNCDEQMIPIDVTAKE